MIEAYIDEAGTHDQAKIIVMGGFLSSYKRWRKFDQRWDAILNPDSGKRVFHATDCLGKDGYGHFAGWSKEKRDALVEALIPVVRSQTLASFACAFSLQDYREVIPEWMQRKWKHPYYVTMFALANVLFINRAKLHLPQGEKIAFTFAHKPKFVGLLADLYNDLKSGDLFKTVLGKMTPDGTPEKDIPIQAADLLCYVVRTFYEKDYFQRDSAHRRTLDLGRRLDLENYLQPDFLNRKALQEFARVYQETQDEAGEWDWNTKRTKKR